MRVKGFFYKFLCSIFIFVSTLNISTLVFSSYLFSKSEVFFSPKDKIVGKLIEKIDQAQTKIYAAVYMFTDKKIAQALINAKSQRYVDVQVITDQTCLEYKYGKVNMLKDGNIDIFVFKNNLKNRKRPSKIMHNKFAILDNSVWTGSFNWTVQATYKNKENVIFTDDKQVYKKYFDEFELLKNKCIKQVAYLTTERKKTKAEKLQDKAKMLRTKLVDFFKDIRNKLSSK